MFGAVMRHGECSKNERKNKEYICLDKPNEELKYHKEWKHNGCKVTRKHGDNNQKYLTRKCITEQTERKRGTA